jgi:transcription initiation factor TFIID TATA-box-binding protein
MIIIGSESEADAEKAAKLSIKDIQKLLATKIRMTEFRVTNIVANADLGCKIDIGKLCEERNVVRNENFPGVVYKQMEHVKSALIFASGKVVFTGAKNKDSIDNAYNELKKKMEKFKKLP